MSPDTLDLILADLIDAYPRQQFTTNSRRIYRQFLADLDLDVLRAAVVAIISTSVYFPTIAEIRRAVAERTLKLPPSEDALAMITPNRDGLPTVPINDLPSLVRLVLSDLGGFATFRTTDKPAVFRRQFLDLYTARREAAIREAQTAHPSGASTEIEPGWPQRQLSK